LDTRSNSSFRVETVDPVAFAEAASRVLRDAWQPPCLSYTPDYVRWQFGFPGGSEAIGVAAFDGGKPVGFFGATPRWMHDGRSRIATHLMSFFAVDPGWRGPHGLALYWKMVEELRRTAKPVVTYVQSGSTAERMLAWNFERAGFRTCALGEYRTYGAAGRPGSVDCTASVVEADDEQFLAVARCCRQAGTIWNDPDRDQLQHYRRDPRGRALVVVRDTSGRPDGAAMLVLSDTLAPQGPESIPMIDSVFLPRPSAEALIALIQFARARWADRATSPVVTAPNLKGIDAATLRAAGLRATPSAFQGYFFTPRGDTLAKDIAGTNLEVV
jgi:hypothetical protein